MIFSHNPVTDDNKRAVTKLPPDIRKARYQLKEGKDSIRYFCVTCKPTKSNGGRTRNLPEWDAVYTASARQKAFAYAKPRMGLNRFDSESITYEGVGGTRKWERIESYGPKFMQNIVQAISRDILFLTQTSHLNKCLCTLKIQ